MSISKTFHQRYLHLLQEYVKPQEHVSFYWTYLLACTFCRNSCFLLTNWGQHFFKRTKCFHLLLEHSSCISCSISLQTVYQYRHVLSFIVVTHNSRHTPVKQDWNISRFWLEIRHIWQIYLGIKKELYNWITLFLRQNVYTKSDFFIIIHAICNNK